MNENPKVVYDFVILKPGETPDIAKETPSDAVLVRYSTDTPLMPVRAGELINTLISVERDDFRGHLVVRVVDIAHTIFTAAGGITHRIRVYTEDHNVASPYTIVAG